MVQTFLPYPDFQKSVKCLDFRRLGKQRSEAMEIIEAIKYGTGWKYHTAVTMWRGYLEALKEYYNTVIWEWIERDYETTMPIFQVKEVVYPHWFGDEAFHASHRSNLLRKNPQWYGQFGWIEPDNLPYVWPKGAE